MRKSSDLAEARSGQETAQGGNSSIGRDMILNDRELHLLIWQLLYYFCPIYLWRIFNRATRRHSPVEGILAFVFSHRMHAWLACRASRARACMRCEKTKATTLARTKIKSRSPGFACAGVRAYGGARAQRRPPTIIDDRRPMTIVIVRARVVSRVGVRQCLNPFCQSLK